jgi:hypothetical protein
LEVKPSYHQRSLEAIQDARYGIACLRKKPEQYTFYLRGTLATLRCIPDYLLEEFNQEFSLEVPLDNQLDIESFRNRALETGNRKATKFIRIFQKKWQKLLADPEVELLLGQSGERNLIIHRRHNAVTQVQKIQLNKDQRYEDVGEATLHFWDKKENLPTREIADLCEYCLEKLVQFRGELVFQDWSIKRRAKRV